jgi:hypothetical protein
LGKYEYSAAIIDEVGMHIERAMNRGGKRTDLWPAKSNDYLLGFAIDETHYFDR